MIAAMPSLDAPNEPKIRRLFLEAVEKPTLKERDAYLDVACHGDVALRARLGVLLRSHREDQFLETPGVEVEPAVPAPNLMAAENPGDLIGRYQLLEKIGEGGCGVVYLAEQSEPVRRRVALKVIKLGMDTRSVIARFEAERQALAMMDHPNIAKVFDAGATDAGRPYFVMELVRGVRITDYCDQNNLPIADRLILFTQVCQAIQHAHQKGIIHRDIKPSNILVTLHDGVPVPKVIDFGIAKATTDQRLTDKTLFTAIEHFIGTPAYMSPEQAEMSGLDIDTRSDIYSLGVLLYELLTGSTPFDAKELMASGIDAIRKTIREQEPVRPSTKLGQTLVAAGVSRLQSSTSDTPGSEEEVRTCSRPVLQLKQTIALLRGDLDWIVMKCLEKDRARRYETANGLASDLQRHLNNEAVLARPPSAAYRFLKLVRRNKLAFAAATVVTLALVLGLAVSSWQMVAARHARDGEQQQRMEAQAAQKVAAAQAQKASESERRSRRLLYASDMNLAQQALKLNNVGRARRLLDRNRPQSGEEDLRGWEWRYLWQLTRSSALVTLTNRPVRGTAVSFSPDGTRLAVGWDGGRVDLWDVPGRRWVRTLTERGHRHHLGKAAFSPVRNLLAASGLGEVVLHDLDAGQESILWRAPDQGPWDIRDLSFSTDGSRVVIYAGSVEKFGDAVWVMNVSSSRIEGRYPTLCSLSGLHGAARLSPDNRRLYLARTDFANYRYSIQCLDVTTGQELWQTERERDYGLTTLALSPDGKVLASGSGFEDPAIRVWDAATGKRLYRLDGHTGWVCKLAFTGDGQRLISAASDQSIRFWDTSTWTETKVLRGHTDEVYALAISESAQLAASAGRNGDLLLWKGDEKSAADGYRRLPEKLRSKEVFPLDHSRVLLLPSSQPPELVDLKSDASPVSLPGIESSTNVSGFFGTNILCQWNGDNQILIHEWRGTRFVQQGAISLSSHTPPKEFSYHPSRQLLAWTEATPSMLVSLASLSTPGRRIELRSDVLALVFLQFSDDGKYLVATGKNDHFLRAWNVETGLIAASINERVRAVNFAAGGRVLVVAVEQGNDHEIRFYDLNHPVQPPRRVSGKGYATALAVSPDGGLVASATGAGGVSLFDPFKGDIIESVHAHLNGPNGVTFSPDGRRLISTAGGREAVKLWDVGNRQELLTLGGTGSLLEAAGWSADGDLILAGPPWQAWRAPSWEEIAMAEAKDQTKDKKAGR